MLRSPRLNPLQNPAPDYASMSQEELAEHYLAGYRRYQQLAGTARHLLNEYDHADDAERAKIHPQLKAARAAANAQMDEYNAIFPFLTQDTVDRHLRLRSQMAVTREGNLLHAARLNPKVPPPSRHRTRGPMESYTPKVFLSEELAWLLPSPAQRRDAYEMLHDYETVIVYLGHGDTAEEYALSMDGRGRYITLIPWYASGSDPDRPLPKKNPFTVRDAEVAVAHAREKGKTALEGIIEAAVRSGVPREDAEKMARQYLGIARRR